MYSWLSAALAGVKTAAVSVIVPLAEDPPIRLILRFHRQLTTLCNLWKTIQKSIHCVLLSMSRGMPRYVVTLVDYSVPLHHQGLSQGNSSQDAVHAMCNQKMLYLYSLLPMSGINGCSSQSSPQDSLSIRSAAASNCSASCSGPCVTVFGVVPVEG